MAFTSPTRKPRRKKSAYYSSRRFFLNPDTRSDLGDALASIRVFAEVALDLNSSQTNGYLHTNGGLELSDGAHTVFIDLDPDDRGSLRRITLLLEVMTVARRQLVEALERQTTYRTELRAIQAESQRAAAAELRRLREAARTAESTIQKKK